LQQSSPLKIVSTFLGAHAVGRNYAGRQSDYVALVIDEMIPAVAKEGLADYVDVFCDDGFFTPEETARILLAGAQYGMRPKIHANELACSGGIQCAVRHHALSCDHLEFTGEEEIQCLLGSDTMPTVLPGAAFFLNMQHAPVRRMMEAGLPVAMASDFNPGSSPSGNMQLVLSFACVNYRMLPEEAINATTINSGYAMGVSDQLGSIAVGKKANFYLTKEIPTYEYLPYAYGENKVERVFLNGVEC
jgi:imidazolonepropionase